MFSHDCRDQRDPPTPKERITRALEQLGADEAEVLATVAERLVMGRAQYGALTLATDKRNFGQEAFEEAADALVYVAAGLIRRRNSCRQDT